MTSSQMFICRNVTFLQALGVEWKVTSNVSTDLMFDINKESLSLLYRLQWFAIGVGGGGGSVAGCHGALCLRGSVLCLICDSSQAPIII